MQLLAPAVVILQGNEDCAILLEICKHKLQYNTIQITIINSDSINCNKKVNKVKWSRSEGAINDKSHWLNLVQCVGHLSCVREGRVDIDGCGYDVMRSQWVAG